MKSIVINGLAIPKLSKHACNADITHALNNANYILSNRKIRNNLKPGQLVKVIDAKVYLTGQLELRKVHTPRRITVKLTK